MGKNPWTAKIVAAWQKPVAAIFETGDLLIKAKQKLPHGGFEKMVRHELPFGERTAQALMAIAKDTRLRKRTMVRFLPSSWRTLYEISRLDDEQFATAFDAGLIHPEMTRADVYVPKPAGAPATQSVLAKYQEKTEPALVSVSAKVIPAPKPGTTITPPADVAARDSAHRLIDALRVADTEVCRAVVKLLQNERAYNLDAVRGAISELLDLLGPPRSVLH